MHIACLRKSIPGILLASVLLSPASAGEAVRAAIGRPVYILLQDSAAPDCSGCAPDMSLIVSPLLALEHRGRTKELARQYGVLRER